MAATAALARGSIHDNVELNRLELDVPGGTAVADYQLAPGVLTITHTEVPAELRHRGVGSELARGALEWARARGLKVVPQCPFVAVFMKDHPEFADLRL
jgi:hypothetical protein